MNAIETKDIVKRYRVYDAPKDRLREMVSLRRKKYHKSFHALNGISLQIPQGKSLGIIGQNGSGKSTLLKIICGVLQPTAGDVHVRGRIGSLLELGAGFNPEFTGRENVYMNGALMGLSEKEIDKRFPEVEAFAEIGSFIDQPVKTYSNGMFMRLAFAAAISIDPDILVIDEALSVGDMFFQHKCISKMESFKNQGKTILLVAHDLNLIRNFCNEAILLNNGQLTAQGDPEHVTEQYMMQIREMQTELATSIFKVSQKTTDSDNGPKIRFGSEAGQILQVATLDKNRKETNAFLAGDAITIRIQIKVSPQVQAPGVTFLLRDERGYNVYGTDTTTLGMQLELDEQNTSTTFFTMSPTLKAGSYSLTVALHSLYTSKINMLLDKIVGVSPFIIIENNSKFLGVVDLKAKICQKRKSKI
jgi:ABC-type polysaccharide/polyol phosphate transport system ATPase subunit